MTGPWDLQSSRSIQLLTKTFTELQVAAEREMAKEERLRQIRTKAQAAGKTDADQEIAEDTGAEEDENDNGEDEGSCFAVQGAKPSLHLTAKQHASSKARRARSNSDLQTQIQSVKPRHTPNPSNSKSPSTFSSSTINLL